MRSDKSCKRRCRICCERKNTIRCFEKDAMDRSDSCRAYPGREGQDWQESPRATAATGPSPRGILSGGTDEEMARGEDDSSTRCSKRIYIQLIRGDAKGEATLSSL